jgi:hypothetical protein
MKLRTYTDVLLETARYYGADPKGRRSLNPAPKHDGSPRCLYIGEGRKRCAFARCCAPGQKEKFRDLENQDASWALSGDFNGNGKVVLAPKYAHLTSPVFWNELQHLHDTDRYWKQDHGLTPQGVRYLDQEIARWAKADTTHQPDETIPWSSK